MIQLLTGARFKVKIASNFEKKTTSNKYEQTIYFIKCFSMNRKRISSISPSYIEIRSCGKQMCLKKVPSWHVRPTKTQISLRIRAVWSESSLSARRNFASLAI